jgi:hypothetical protein
MLTRQHRHGDLQRHDRRDQASHVFDLAAVRRFPMTAVAAAVTMATRSQDTETTRILLVVPT